MEEARLAALSRYFAERPELAIVSAYLFGSHAAGRAHRESDIDVAVLLDWARYPTARERFEARLRRRESAYRESLSPAPREA